MKQNLKSITSIIVIILLCVRVIRLGDVVINRIQYKPIIGSHYTCDEYSFHQNKYIKTTITVDGYIEHHNTFMIYEKGEGFYRGFNINGCDLSK